MEITAKYRTKDGTEDYTFRFLQTEMGDFRVYIIEQPRYGGRAEDSHSTHRLDDECGKYICWSAAIDSYEAAKKVAKMWAEATEKYRKIGERF